MYDQFVLFPGVQDTDLFTRAIKCAGITHLSPALRVERRPVKYQVDACFALFFGFPVAGDPDFSTCVIISQEDSRFARDNFLPVPQTYCGICFGTGLLQCHFLLKFFLADIQVFLLEYQSCQVKREAICIVEDKS